MITYPKNTTLMTKTSFFYTKLQIGGMTAYPRTTIYYVAKLLNAQILVMLASADA